MQPTRLPRKKDVALQLLEQATVFVHLDPRAEAVRVPPWFKKQPQLVLQIGLNMAVPIPDLDLDDNGLSCTLSFNRSPFMCVIPWSAVFALVDENRQGMVWPDDVPPELAAQAAQAKAAPARPELKVAPNPSTKDEAPVKTAAKTAPSAKAKRARKAATKTRTRPEPVPKRVAEPVVKRAAGGAKARAAAPAAKPRAVAKRAPAAVAQKAAPQKAPAQKAPVAQKAAPRAEPAIAPAPAAAAGGGSKRKLPPYLRIVK